MDDYFTNFSFIVALASKDQQDYALTLFLQMSAIRQGEDIPADFPAVLKDFCEDWCFEVETDEPNAIWLHSTTGGIDAVCAFLQYLLARFQMESCVTFEWSHDCSKPRTDAYGGGAALITAKEIKTMNTAEWLRGQTQSPPAT